MTVSTNSRTSKTIRTLAQKYKTNRYGIGLKAFSFLLVFCGIVLSVLASLTCQFLLQNDSLETTVVSYSLLPTEGVEEAWLGLFSYEIIQLNNPDKNITAGCSVYDNNLFRIAESPYVLFSLGQVCAVLAPGLALVAVLVFLLQMAVTKFCCNYNAIAATLFLTSLMQAGTFAVFAERALCPDGTCALGHGAWISAASAGTFLLSSWLMGCTPLLDTWVDRSLQQTVGQPLKSNHSLDSSNSIITEPSTDDQDGLPLTVSLKRDSVLTCSLQKAQKVWGSVFDIADEDDKDGPKKVQQEMNRMCDAMARSSTANTQSQTTCGGCQEVAREVGQDLQQVFGMKQADSPQLASSAAESPHRTPPSQTTQKRSQQYTQTSPSPESSFMQENLTLDQPSMSLHTSSSFNTSYFMDGEVDTGNLSLETFRTDEEAPPPLVANNPLIAKMHNSLKQGREKQKAQQVQRLATDTGEEKEDQDWTFFGSFFGK